MPGALGMGHLTRPAGQENAPTAAARVPRVVVARMCCFPCPCRARCPPKPHQSESWSRDRLRSHRVPQMPTQPVPHLLLPTRLCSRRWSWAFSLSRLSSLVNSPSECRGALGQERERQGVHRGMRRRTVWGRIMGGDGPWEWGRTREFGEPHTDGSGLGTGPAVGRRLPRVGEMHKDGWEEG